MSTSLVLFMRQVFMDFFYSFRDKFTIYILAFCILSLPLSPALFQSLSLSLSLTISLSHSPIYKYSFILGPCLP